MKQRIDPAALSMPDLRQRLRRLQARMQALWDSWQSWEKTFPDAAQSSRKHFEELEQEETVLLNLMRSNHKEDPMVLVERTDGLPPACGCRGHSDCTCGYPEMAA